MFVISRTRPSAQDVLEEKVDIVGTTGNIYTVTITHEPRCTCPDAMKGNQCKHIIYVCQSFTTNPNASPKACMIDEQLI